jgi:TatD DNase family protein
MQEAPFIDIHTHKNVNNDEVRSLFNVNIASKETWDEDFEVCSVGIHPWHIDTKQLIAQFFLLEDLCKKENVKAIGEIGLDKSIEIPLELQTRVFEQQIEIADYHQKPIIIHCVRAFYELISIKKRVKTQMPFIVHGFNKNEQVLEELLKNGFYISLGAALLQPESNASQVISLIPADKLFLETDVKDLPIQQIFLAAADKLQIEISTLKSTINNNYQHLFS